MCSLYCYTKSHAYRGVPMHASSPDVGIEQAWKLSSVGNCFTIICVCGRSHLFVIHGYLDPRLARPINEILISLHMRPLQQDMHVQWSWSGLTLASAYVLVKNSTCSAGHLLFVQCCKRVCLCNCLSVCVSPLCGHFQACLVCVFCACMVGKEGRWYDWDY